MSSYQALLYFHRSAVSKICFSWISFHWRSIPNKESVRPNYIGEIRQRTEDWDKIKRPFPFRFLTRVALHSASPSVSISVLLWRALRQMNSLWGGRGQSTLCVSTYSSLNLCVWVSWLVIRQTTSTTSSGVLTHGCSCLESWTIFMLSHNSYLSHALS